MMLNQNNHIKNNVIWKAIPEYEGLYDVSNFGEVRTLPKKGGFKTNRILKAMMTNDGYERVELRKNGKRKTFKVHTLVTLAFIGLNTDSLTINHIDGVKTNNHIDNLEYCTHAKNIEHAIQLGLHNNRGIENGRAKLNSEQVLEIRAMYTDKVSSQELGKIYGVSRATIHRIISRKTWKHI